MELRGLVDDLERFHHRRLQHVAFEYPSVDDLLAAYARLKGLGIGASGPSGTMSGGGVSAGD